MTLPVDKHHSDTLLTCAEMGACDRLTIEGGTPGFTLMLRAGRGAARCIRRAMRPGRVLVACGPGNNGGDGFVIADDLRSHGWDVCVALLGEPGTLRGDAATAASLWGAEIHPLSGDDLDAADILIDALFGAVAGKGDVRRIALDIVQGNVTCLVDHFEPALRARVHQVPGQFGLAVDYDMLPAGQFGDVDADQPLTIGKVEAVMRQAFGFEPRVEPDPLHQRDSDVFQHTGANTAQHVIGRPPLQHHALDSLRAQ